MCSMWLNTNFQPQLISLLKGCPAGTLLQPNCFTPHRNNRSIIL